MMKCKFLTVLFTIVLALGLCFGPVACGKKDDSGNNGGTQQGGTQQGGTQQGGTQQGGSQQGGSQQGGSQQGGGDGSAQTINVLMLANYYEGKFYDAYFQDIEEQLAAEGLNYKIEARYEYLSDYYNLLDESFDEGEAPDIFYVRPNDILKYKSEIVSLQSYADTQTDVDFSDIYPLALNMYRYNPETGDLGNPADDLYAFPKDIATMQLGYNKTFLTKFTQEFRMANIQFPWEGDYATGAKTYTWEQYKKICDIITKSDKINRTEYAMDVPPIEVLARSFGGELIDLDGGRANGKVSSLAEGAVQKAIEYQAELVAAGAHHADNYANFTGNRLGFYGAIGSWEIGEYNEHAEMGDYEWGVMPWPTVDGSVNWQGTIMSSGLVVSKNCAENTANPQKGEIAKRIILSLLTSATQHKLVEENISLPLRPSMADSYRDPANDNIYSPSTRGFFLDVVSGKNGFIPAQYRTYDSVWLDTLSNALEAVWNEGADSALAKFNSIDWAEVQADMQTQYDLTKNR